MDEQQLVFQCCMHNRTAEGELYALFAPRLRAVCRRYVNDPEDAEDLLQDAFVRIFTSIDRFCWRGEGSLWMWMKRITANLAVDRLRKQSNVTWVSIDNVTPPAEEPSVEEVNLLSEETLLSFVSALPMGYRTVFNLVCMEGMSHRDAAKLLGIAEKSSSSQLARARAILAKNIKDYLRQNA
jgi:RNA polymerase sigma-70 factor (ECF subfamily)